MQASWSVPVGPAVRMIDCFRPDRLAVYLEKGLQDFFKLRFRYLVLGPLICTVRDIVSVFDPVQDLIQIIELQAGVIRFTPVRDQEVISRISDREHIFPVQLPAPLIQRLDPESDPARRTVVACSLVFFYKQKSLVRILPCICFIFMAVIYLGLPLLPLQGAQGHMDPSVCRLHIIAYQPSFIQHRKQGKLCRFFPPAFPSLLPVCPPAHPLCAHPASHHIPYCRRNRAALPPGTAASISLASRSHPPCSVFLF